MYICKKCWRNYNKKRKGIKNMKKKFLVLILIFTIIIVSLNFYVLSKTNIKNSVITNLFKNKNKITEQTSQETKIPISEKVHSEEIQEKIAELIVNEISNLSEQSTSEKLQEKLEIMNNNQGKIFCKNNIRIDYEIKYNDNNKLSFILKKEEGVNSSFTEIHTFNYNIENGEKINLKDVLGEDWKNKVDKQIYNEIQKQESENKNIKYFHKNDMQGKGEDNYFNGVSENENFYINENGNIVIIFDKYSIAPGYMGFPEFEIKE